MTTKCLFANLKFRGSVTFAAFLLLFLVCFVFWFCPFCLVLLSFSVVVFFVLVLVHFCSAALFCSVPFCFILV